MSYVVSNNCGCPVACAADEADAQVYAWRHAGGKLAGSKLEWTKTGKMMVGGRWNGWEVREVVEVGAR
jgi:hypothetical protein